MNKNRVSSKPKLMRGSRSLADWILAGGPSNKAPCGWRLQLRWHAWWLQFLQQRQQQLFSNKALERDPVFVLGLWRSGTTILHEWLASLPMHTSPATWQCFNPFTFALTGAPGGRDQAVQRPMDEGKISSLSAQEDEFALLLQGAPSLYRGFIDPRRLSEVSELLHADERLGDDWVQNWKNFLTAVESLADGQRLVLKSPNHTFRLDLIGKEFPQATYIWIGRSARQVWFSNIRMWRAMFAEYSLWPWQPENLDSFILDCFKAYTQRLSWAMENIERSRVAWVDFDDLYNNSLGTLRNCSRLMNAGRHASQTEEQLQEVLKKHPLRPPALPARVEVSPEVSMICDQIDALHQQARSCWKHKP